MKSIAGVLVTLLLGGALTLALVRYVPELADAIVIKQTHVSTTGGARSTAVPPTPFAGRLSYELNGIPLEAPREIASESSTSAGPVAPRPATSAERAPDVVPGELIPNVRAITPVPPDARDRTTEIQKESRAAQSAGSK